MSFVTFKKMILDPIQGHALHLVSKLLCFFNNEQFLRLSLSIVTMTFFKATSQLESVPQFGIV